MPRKTNEQKKVEAAKRAFSQASLELRAANRALREREAKDAARKEKAEQQVPSVREKKPASK